MKALAAIIIALAATWAYGHSGDTDTFGCHIDHRTGLRHCH